MRDIKRIEPMLDSLKTLWYKYPDLRLGQLLHKIVVNSGWITSDMFYIEDEVVAEQVEKEIREVLEKRYT